MWEFPKIRVPYFAVLIKRILLFRVLYWGPLFSETAQVFSRFKNGLTIGSSRDRGHRGTKYTPIEPPAHDVYIEVFAFLSEALGSRATKYIRAGASIGSFSRGLSGDLHIDSMSSVRIRAPLHAPGHVVYAKQGSC